MFSNPVGGDAFPDIGSAPLLYVHFNLHTHTRKTPTRVFLFIAV